MKKVFVCVYILALALVLTLASCSSSGTSGQDESENTAEASVLDLTGQWKQTNSSADDSYMAAAIDSDTITVYWVYQDTGTYALYWAGTYVAPDTADEPYSWDSENDHDQTDTALLASGDDTKTFTYEDGQLSYSASALGVTQTITMERADGVLDSIADAAAD